MSDWTQDIPIKPKESAKQNNLWILTFADFMSIMLAFFVLIYSTVATDSSRWKDVQKSLQARFSSSTRWEVQFKPAGEEITSPVTTSRMRAADIEYILNILAEKIAKAPELAILTIRPQDDRIILSLPADAIFAGNDTKPRKEAGSIVGRLSEILSSINNQVEVDVHNGSASSAYSDWETSLTRALTTTRALHQYGYLYHIETFGFDDAQKADISSAAAATPQLQAVRVDIVIRQQVAH